MRVRIDFSGARPAPRLASVVLVVLGLVSVATSAWQYREADHQRQGAESALAAARAQRPVPPAELPAQSIAGANRVIRELNLPWQALLTLLEGHLSDEVALLAVEPEAESRRLRLQAEAKSADQMLAFVAALKADPALTSVALLRHEVNEGDRNRPYRFTMVLEWQADL